MTWDMLKLLNCAHGHYWEKPINNGLDESPQVCPVCGQAAESMPLLDLAPTEAPPIARPEAPSPPPPLRDKDRRPIIAGYEILSDLGKAPSGVHLYKARQAIVNRIVVLKVVFAKDDPRQFAWGSLRGEASALGRLAHPNIVQILEAGERERQLFYNAVESLDGPTLADLLSGKPLPIRQAVAMLETVARAVHHAHQKNILHRNLKPASILLASEAAPPLAHCIAKITDFGLARRPVEGDISDLELQGKLPCYLAPEQAWGRAKEIGPATDVNALGAILYELIGGRPPFCEATATETLDAIQSREPPMLSRFCSRAPRNLEAICRKCLAKQPRRRYASALDLAEDLRRFLDDRPVKARAAGNVERMGKWLRRNYRTVALILLGLWLGASVIGGLISTGRERPSALSLSPEQVNRQTIANREADYQQTIARLGAQLDAQSEMTYLADLLLAQRFLATGDKERAQKLLERCPRRRYWEWDYLNGQIQGKNQVYEFRADLPILCMVFDDEYLIAGGGKEPADDLDGEKGEVSVWDIRTRERLWHWDFDAPVRSLSFCNVGHLAIVSSSRRQERFGSLQVRYLRGGNRSAGNLVFPPCQFKDSKPTSVIQARSYIYVLASSDDGKLHQVGADDGGRNRTWRALSNPDRPRGLHARLQQLDIDQYALISPDGHQIVVLMEPGGAKPSIELPGCGGTTFLDLSYNDVDKLLAAAALDGKIRIWNVQSLNREPLVLHGHKGGVSGVSFSIDGQRLASCGQDGTVRIWDVKQGIELLTLKGYHAAARVILEPTRRYQNFPSNTDIVDRQTAGRIAVAHENKVTVILPPPRKSKLHDR